MPSALIPAVAAIALGLGLAIARWLRAPSVPPAVGSFTAPSVPPVAGSYGAHPPIRWKSEFRGLTQSDAMAGTGLDFASASFRGFVPISRTWSLESGVHVLAIIYEQRGPDTSQVYANCPSCCTRLGRNAWQCARCGYRFGLAPGARPGSIAQAPSRWGMGGIAGTVLLVLALVFGSLWFLNNAALGLDIKCQYLNDPSACFRLNRSDPGALARQRFEIDLRSAG